jgi:G3E family GTPase
MDGDSERTGKVPLLILTGFLGAGKTTTINRLLRGFDGRRLAILVNDVGRVSIDSELILARDGELIELAGGCVCCSVDVQTDLWQGAIELIERLRPDHLVLETTGIAEPHIILEQLAARPLVRSRIAPAGIVCVVDAEDGAWWVGERPEARAQVEHADRLLLSKLDRASPALADEARARLAALRPDCEPVSFPFGDVGDAALARWLLEPRLIVAPGDDDEHGRHRHGGLEVVTFLEDAPLARERLLRTLDRLGSSLMRAKGFVYLADEPRRAFVERASARLELRYDDPWGDEPPRTALVLIGAGLDVAALRMQLWG